MPSDDYTVLQHETKDSPNAIPQQKIVSAYGLRKCPKLVEQIASSNSLEVRVNALIALCDELENPLSVYGCTEAGVVPVLSGMITDTDYSTRLHASKALAIMAKDANGLDAILRDDAIPEILLGCSDPSEDVRSNVFECLQQVTRTADGVDACNAANATKAFVDAIRSEGDAIRRILLPALYNIAGSDVGLIESLASGAVQVCVNLLDSTDSSVIASSARALGFICLDERGKSDSLQHNAVEKLTNVLIRTIPSTTSTSISLKQSSNVIAGKNVKDYYRKTVITSQVKASLLMALTSITSTDEGKRQCNDDAIIDTIVTMLYDMDDDSSTSGNRLVKLNALKVISNIAVYPPIRKRLIDQKDNRCLSKLREIKECGDGLLVRHADIAVNAVTWKP